MAIFYFEYLLFVVVFLFAIQYYLKLIKRKKIKKLIQIKENHIPLFYNFHIY